MKRGTTDLEMAVESALGQLASGVQLSDVVWSTSRRYGVAPAAIWQEINTRAATCESGSLAEAEAAKPAARSGPV
jgi:hypothetical protein